MTAARVTQAFVEALTAANPNAMLTQEVVEVLTAGSPHAFVTHLIVEVLTPTSVAAPPSTARQPVVFIVT